jgi:predicted Zn-dependent peptidase/soluble lytic murein transglycosylase-like protein
MVAMKVGKRRAAVAAVVAVSVLSLAGVARSPSIRASFSAAYKAFRDPSLIDAPEAAPAAAAAACAPKGDTSLLLDAQIASDFQKATDEDLDDPEGATLATLTMPDMRIPVTRRTMRFVRFFGRTENGRAAFLQRFRRGGAYRNHIEQALREAGLPEDLVWVAGIESGFDPTAVSHAGAAGLWQFMPQTGALYGLYQSPFVDERKSIVRSTTAAVAHLRDLYERFGRWDLALAAYNYGHDGVLKAMERALATRPPQDQGKPIEFADLAEAGLLPEETANYVPQISAFAIVAANRARFGLDSLDLAPAPPLEMGELAFPEGTRLRTIARAAGIPTSLLREYNPELLRDRLPMTGGDYLVHLPADRVQRTLAAFPAYLDNEVLGADETDPPEPVPSADLTAGAEEKSLPRRPSQLGHNRLPEFSVPGSGPAFLAAGMGPIAPYGTKLPQVFVGGGLGWNRPANGDPLGLMNAETRAPSSMKGRELAVEKQLGFLDPAARAAAAPDPFVHFTLPNGIAIHLRTDSAAPRVAITTRIAASDAPVPMADGASDLAARPELILGAGETRHTITVGPRDLEAGIEVAAGRLRLELARAGDAHAAELRRQVTGPRRLALESTPYGKAYLALSEALFPSGHPLEGTVLGAWEDAALARDLLLTESLRQERSARRASLTLVGDVTRMQAQKVLEQLLGGIVAPIFDAPIPPHPREERIAVEDGVPSPRALYGWIGPKEGDPGDAPMRVAMEILIGPKNPRLDKVLKEERQLASLVKGALDIGPRASVAAIELSAAVPHELSEVEARMDAEITALGEAGPTGAELGLAKALLKLRIQKDIASATGPVVANAPRSAVSARIRRMLQPGSAERLMAAIDDVNAAAVKAIVKRTLSKSNRVVVTTNPKTGSEPAP